MKKSKILTLFLALAMMLTLALPFTASAAGSIEINGSQVNAQVFNAYKVLTVETNTDKSSYIYELNPAYVGFETFYASTMTPETDLVEYIKSLLDSDGVLIPAKQGELDALARALWNWSESNKAALTIAGAFSTATGAANKVTFASLPAGYYVVAGSGVFGESTAKTFAALCTVTDDAKTTVDLKADAPEIDKTVYNHNTSDWIDWTDIDMGADAEFKLTSAVPNMLGYQKYTFIVHDTMSKGLTFNNDVVITVDGETLTKDTDYTVETGDSDEGSGDYVDGSTITITFNNFIQYAGQAGAEIVITYSAELNEDAIIGAPGNPNKAYLEYSNNPNAGGDGETGETPPDEVVVYTFDLEIYKYTGDLEADEDYPLEGAEFTLYYEDENGDAVSVVGANGSYRLATTEDTSGTTTTLVSGADGLIRIKGLDAGTYALKETKAPEGFNLIAGFITEIEIKHNSPNKGGYSLLFEGKESDYVNVLNNTGNPFPGTGGIGTTLFVIGGLLILGLGVAAFVIYRKKSILNTMK